FACAPCLRHAARPFSLSAPAPPRIPARSLHDALPICWFSTGDSMLWLRDLAAALEPRQPLYITLYSTAIIFFCFFYTALVFNSRDRKSTRLLQSRENPVCRLLLEKKKNTRLNQSHVHG